MTQDQPDPAGLIDAITTLAVVLEHENAALLDSDFSISGVLASAKRNALAALEPLLGAGAALSTRPNNRMIALQRRLDDAIGKNRVLLQRSIDTQQRVIATVVMALDPTVGEGGYPTHYGSDTAPRSTAPVALVLQA